MSLTKLSEWAQHFGPSHQVVKEHIETQERVQRQLLDAQKLDAISFSLPPKLDKNLYLQIHAKANEILRHDLWKAL